MLSIDRTPTGVDIRPEKIKKVGLPIFAMKIGRVCSPPPRVYFLNLGAEAMQNRFMCVHSWACRASEFAWSWVQSGCIPIYLVKIPFGTVTIYFEFHHTHTCCKIQSGVTKKKEHTFVFRFFGSVGKGQTNIFFFLGLLLNTVNKLHCQDHAPKESYQSRELYFLTLRQEDT